jgi:hypothetical protein
MRTEHARSCTLIYVLPAFIYVTALNWPSGVWDPRLVGKISCLVIDGRGIACPASATVRILEVDTLLEIAARWAHGRIQQSIICNDPQPQESFVQLQQRQFHDPQTHLA